MPHIQLVLNGSHFSLFMSPLLCSLFKNFVPANRDLQVEIGEWVQVAPLLAVGGHLAVEDHLAAEGHLAVEGHQDVEGHLAVEGHLDVEGHQDVVDHRDVVDQALVLVSQAWWTLLEWAQEWCLLEAHHLWEAHVDLWDLACDLMEG